MHLERAKQFLKNVIDKKEIVPFKRFLHGVGRKAQVSPLSPSFFFVLLPSLGYCACLYLGPYPRVALHRTRGGL
jgi:hypothetical protein